MNNTKSARAVEAFEKGNNCAMAVFSTFAPDFGVQESVALKIAAPFGGGMGRMGSTCGAVTGAYMTLGLAFQTQQDEPLEDMKNRLYLVIREFAREFAARHGSIVCREILGCDLSAPEGIKEFKERDLMHAVCVDCVRTAAELVERMLDHERIRS